MFQTRRRKSLKIIQQSARMLDPLSKTDGLQRLRLCELAGRTCYDSRDKITWDSYERFLKSIIKRGHTSVLEHAKVTVEITTSRDVLAEITRHRLCSFSVQSQRYVKADSEEGIEFVQPDFYVPYDGDKVDAKRWTASRTWEQAMRRAENDYQALLYEYGLPPEDARKVLPNSIATQIVMTANLRELMHIIELRTSPRAYPEMRTMMSCVLKAMEDVFPPFWKWGQEETSAC